MSDVLTFLAPAQHGHDRANRLTPSGSAALLFSPPAPPVVEQRWFGDINDGEEMFDGEGCS